MKFRFLISSVLACAAAATLDAAVAQQPTSPAPAKSTAADKHLQEDISRHRKMAQAHEEAAKCLESGAKENVCHDKMRATCQGIAIGKYCGMKHAH